eukprot:COSAG01_NODE_5508_length_4212_cov_27.624449_4_plen_48_part_00
MSRGLNACGWWWRIAGQVILLTLGTTTFVLVALSGGAGKHSGPGKSV